MGLNNLFLLYVFFKSFIACKRTSRVKLVTFIKDNLASTS